MVYALEPNSHAARTLRKSHPKSKYGNLEIIDKGTKYLSEFHDNFFARIEAHYVFTDPAFMSRHFGDEEVRDYDQKHFLQVLCETLGQIGRILEPGGRLIISGEFKQERASDVRERIIRFLSKNGYSMKISGRHCTPSSAYSAGKGWHKLIIATKPNK